MNPRSFPPLIKYIAANKGRVWECLGFYRLIAFELQEHIYIHSDEDSLQTTE